jgi:outer membrane protein TolC
MNAYLMKKLLSIALCSVMKRPLILAMLSVGCGLAASAQPHTLQQLKDSALQHNIAIRSAKHNIEAAHQQRREAFTKFFPTVSGTAMTFNANRGMAKMNIDPQEFIPTSMASMISQILSPEMLAAFSSPISMSMMKNGTIASLMAVQPVFAGGQIVNGNRLARVGEEVSRLQLQLSENEVEKQTEQYYWQLVSLLQKEKTLDAVDSLLADIYKDVEVAVRAGVTLRNDLLQVQLRQNDVKGQRLKLQNACSLLKMLLAQYCGLFSDPKIEIPAPPSAPKGATIVSNFDSKTIEAPSGAVGGALTSLPEYQLLEKQVEAAVLQRKMEVGKNLPSLAVGAGYNYHNLLDNDRTFAMAFATVSVPISDWWGGSHAVKRRKIEQQKAEEQLADNAQLLTIRMQKACNDVVEAQQQLQLAQQANEQAEENLRLNRDRYRAGTSTMSNLLEAQLLCQQARDKYVDAYSDLQLRLLDYRQATGQH